METTELKRELARVRTGKRGRYPTALREAVLEYASRAMKQGRRSREVEPDAYMRRAARAAIRQQVAPLPHECVTA
jgi:hypothetical protein